MKRINVNGDRNIITGDNPIIFVAPDERREQGVIEDIFQFVLDKIANQTLNKSRPEKLLHTREKIELNFKNVVERDEVKQYFTHSYNKISIIEKYFETLQNEDQNDIHNFAYSNYCELKTQLNTPILILRELFKVFIPDTKDRNPQYVNIANSIVLFFFDDCTIFEKTEKELSRQTTLFD